MKNYDTSQFEKDIRALGITLTEAQTEQFLIYYELLSEWNDKINLTAITDYEDVLKKHFVDSLSLVKVVDATQPMRVIDVGTGAGFPGLALKIAFPNLQMTLLDSLNKRILFLRTVIERLELTGVEVIHGRAEDFARAAVATKTAQIPDAGRSLREKFDLCVSRAVANLSTLSEYCLPYVKEGGWFVPYKSEKVAEEIEPARRAISLLGGELVKTEEFQLPDSDIFRSFPVIQKKKKTPETYPRKAGLPGREPL